MGIRLSTGLGRISRAFFYSSLLAERVHLVLELPQALVYNLQALRDLTPEILF